MVLSSWFSSSKERSVDELIAAKQYGKAVERLYEEFKQGSRDPRLRLQLADVLTLSGKGSQAVPILRGLADDYAREGYAAKAIATLKKIERIEPGRADVEQKLAGLIEKRRQETVSTLSRPAPALPELGMEEITPVSVASEAAAVVAEEPEEAPRDELLLSLQETLEASSAQPAGSSPSAAMVASPLFSDFSQDELVAVIRGLELQTFEPGDIIITQGEPGDSLFILTTGTAKAFVREASGRHRLVRRMSDGAFFGEISILTGEPRTATVTAATGCDLLELQRSQLDEITKTRPRVLEVLRQFCEERTRNR
jgi:cAMP-dependent protein kinase regulator